MRTWVSEGRTVMVRQEGDFMTVATRSHSSAIWGPPTTVVEELMIVDAVKIIKLQKGDRFAFRDEVWRVGDTNANYVDAVAERSNTSLLFYDPVTAAKSGDLSYDVEVVRIGA